MTTNHPQTLASAAPASGIVEIRKSVIIAILLVAGLFAGPVLWLMRSSHPVIAPPDGALTRKDVTALKQLETWKRLKVNFTEHNPSCTNYVRSNEWIAAMNWVYENWDVVGGISFLPSDDHTYPLAPYAEITKDRYDHLVSEFPTHIDYSLLSELESDDNTTCARDFACVGGNCEV